MLRRLDPEEAGAMWELLSPWVALTLPAEVDLNEKTTANILGAVLGNRLVAWLIHEDEVPQGVMLTQLLIEPFSDRIDLLIFSLAIPGKLSTTSWKNDIDLLRQYAKEQGCSNITAYTNNPVVIRLAERLGETQVTSYLKVKVI